MGSTRDHPPAVSSGAAAAELRTTPAHRAIRRFAISPVGLGTALVLAGAFDALIWSLRAFIGTAWAELLAFWTRKLELGAVVSVPPASGSWLQPPLPMIEIASRSPGPSDWLFTVMITAAALLGTRFLPERVLPLRYLARVVCLVQGTAIVYFAAARGPFPYTLAGYSRSMGESLLWLMMIVPWIHAFTYGIFAFSTSRKIALTAVTLAFVAVAGPLLLMAHVFLIDRLSLLVMPVLYFMFGIPLLIFACIALYGWAMSWKVCGSDTRVA